eukprot:gnl/MRDRNA2_/MRDRNA2_76764_c0_seq1.p1 gnl/MRDRNA2_/MRDRNA2_76764_c0~~gnl/MRDRNA2_/MRDRNA2_76764_c0_seq1.p1  ORF type:complete len:168 (-),score=25.42 gnl/MRDRNA2_/MRDRNA2_76764_c0_seq1:184-687(-)
MKSLLLKSFRGVATPIGRNCIGPLCKLSAHQPGSTGAVRMFSSGLYYTKTHEWMKLEGGNATIGITDYGQDRLGEVQYVELPDKGTVFKAGQAFASLEATKAVGEVYAPGPCEVIEFNDAVDDNPSLINKAPMSDGWLIKAKYSGETSSLLDQAAYDEHVKADEAKN